MFPTMQDTYMVYETALLLHFIVVLNFQREEYVFCEIIFSGGINPAYHEER